MSRSPEEILAMRSVTELEGLSLQDFADRNVTQPEFEHISALCGSTWRHSGDPKRPHAILTSGKHSDGFIDTLAMLTRTNICDIMAAKLAQRLIAEIPDPRPSLGWIVGSDHASAVFSQRVAFYVRGPFGYPRYDFTEKGKGEVGEDVQRWERFVIGPEELVMNVEELMSTFSTLMRVRAGIRRFHPHPIQFVPIVAVLVNRTGVVEIEGNRLVSPFVFNFNIYPSNDCPLCAAGSVAISEPKKHWAELTA